MYVSVTWKKLSLPHTSYSSTSSILLRCMHTVLIWVGGGVVPIVFMWRYTLSILLLCNASGKYKSFIHHTPPPFPLPLVMNHPSLFCLSATLRVLFHFPSLQCSSPFRSLSSVRSPVLHVLESLCSFVTGEIICTKKASTSKPYSATARP